MVWAVEWTTGYSVERRGPVWPPAAPGVERSASFGLDVKDGKGLGRWNGVKGTASGVLGLEEALAAANQPNSLTSPGSSPCGPAGDDRASSAS
jgi:hypothetical protein